MTEIRIFESTKTLEVTKAFAKAASRYGSEAYMKLRSARNDFPDFKVTARPAPQAPRQGQSSRHGMGVPKSKHPAARMGEATSGHRNGAGNHYC